MRGGRSLGALHLAFAAFASALAACGGSATPAAVPTAAPSSSVETFQSRTTPFPAPSSTPVVAVKAPGRAPRTAVLKFELKGRYFPLPVVYGSIGGEPTWMLVDTGANSHVIARWLAKKAKLAMKPLGDVGTDHTGRAVTTYSVDHPSVVIDTWGPLEDGPMLVTDVPDPIEKLGIGAFISPQWLGADGEAVVMDLVAKTMSSAPFDDAVRALEAHGKPLVPTGGRICEDTGSAIKGLAFVIPATIDGNKVELLLDTGAHRTDLLTTAKVGQRLAPRSVPSQEQMYAASGLVHTRLVRGANVKVGEWAITTDIDLIPGVADPVCPRDGVVSMDVLKSCVLVLGRKQMMGRCGD
jgi:predicted aspartyl protease